MIKAAVVTAALSLCALHFSPALSSLSLMLFFFLLLLQAKKNSFFKNKIIIYLTISWCLWQLLNQFYFGYDSEAIRKTLLRLPLLLMALVWFLRSDIPSRYTVPGILILGIVHSWIGGASVLNYLAHYRFLNQMVLESKPLPLFSSVYHIEFSLILAVVSLLQISCIRLTSKGWQRSIMIVTAFINIIALHVLSARTGILGFWLGIPFLLGTLELPAWLLGRRKWWLLSLPLILVMMVPSLRNRIINTMEDLTAVTESQNLGDKSFGRRWESWKISADIIKKNPWKGVGLGGVELAVHREFEKKQTYLHVTDRIQPHNQFLELALQSGVVVPVLLIVWFIWMVCVFYRQRNFQGMGVMVALTVSMLFESYLERQSGVAIFVVALFFVFFTEKKEQHFQ